MRIRILAVGRIRSGPERALIDDYLARFDRAGRPLSLGPAEEIEVETRKASGPAPEADALSASIPQGSLLCALDERGRILSSTDFAKALGDWRDQGRGTACFVIGGADGLAEDLKARADHTLSLGSMVWPHALARVMLTEQLYRAASILGGLPYHRS